MATLLSAPAARTSNSAAFSRRSFPGGDSRSIVSPKVTISLTGQPRIVRARTAVCSSVISQSRDGVDISYCGLSTQTYARVRSTSSRNETRTDHFWPITVVAADRSGLTRSHSESHVSVHIGQPKRWRALGDGSPTANRLLGDDARGMSEGVKRLSESAGEGVAIPWCHGSRTLIDRFSSTTKRHSRPPFPSQLADCRGSSPAPNSVAAQLRKQLRWHRTAAGTDGTGMRAERDRDQHRLATARTVGKRRLLVAFRIVIRLAVAAHPRDLRSGSRMIPNSRLLVSGDSAVVRDVYIPVESTQTWLRSVRGSQVSSAGITGTFRCSPSARAFGDSASDWIVDSLLFISTATFALFRRLESATRADGCRTDRTAIASLC